MNRRIGLSISELRRVVLVCMVLTLASSMTRRAQAEDPPSSAESGELDFDTLESAPPPEASSPPVEPRKRPERLKLKRKPPGYPELDRGQARGEDEKAAPSSDPEAPYFRKERHCARQACWLLFGAGTTAVIQSRTGQSFSGLGAWTPSFPIGAEWTIQPSFLVTALNYQNSSQLAWIVNSQLGFGYLADDLAPLSLALRGGVVTWAGETTAPSFGFEIGVHDVIHLGPIDAVAFRYDLWALTGRTTHVVSLVLGFQLAPAPGGQP